MSRKVLCLTKPKGKIYKTKSLGHYITHTQDLSFIWPVDGNLAGTSTSGQRGSKGNGNKRVLHSPPTDSSFIVECRILNVFKYCYLAVLIALDIYQFFPQLNGFKCCLVWLGLVLFYGNHCRLFNAKGPGGNTPQGTNYTATCLSSRKLSKLDEPDTLDAAGEARTSS